VLTIEAGTMVGPFEVVSLLGSGGMGDVYRGRDTRLGREVALKVLPAHLADDKEGLLRFAHEARAASALNHPNIVTIYDIDSADGVHFIAMEYVEGD
jgi:serine/threonine protein kinase